MNCMKTLCLTILSFVFIFNSYAQSEFQYQIRSASMVSYYILLEGNVSVNNWTCSVVKAWLSSPTMSSDDILYKLNLLV